MLCGGRKALLLAAALVAAAATAASASAGSPVHIVSATVNPDRSVSVTWNVPSGEWEGVFIINPTSTADFTGEMPFGGDTIEYDLLGTGWTNYKTLPLDLTIQRPTTIYAQVQLTDPYGNGGCEQGDLLVDCDSQVVALTVNPICSKVLVKAGYYSKKLIRRGHWLRRNGHYVRRNGHRVWVKARYRRVWHPPVYKTQCY